MIYDVAGAAEGGSPMGKRLYRSKDGRILGGVIAGLGEYLDVDPVLLRLILVIGIFVTGGWLLLAYFAAWVIVPDKPEGAGAEGASSSDSTELGERVKQSVQEMVDEGARLAREITAGLRSSMAESDKSEGRSDTSEAAPEESGGSNGARILGILLIAGGVIALLNKIFYYVFRANLVVPITLVVLGIALIVSGRRN